MSYQRVFLSLGSNLGDREASLYKAVSDIRSLGKRVKLSSLYETKPIDFTDQPDFLNAVCEITTELEPAELLHKLQTIELDLGRVRKAPHKGPRSIDIDIVLYGSLVLNEVDLIIPHPGVRERKFVMIPLLELDPLLRDPAIGDRYSDVISRLGKQGIYYFTMNRYSFWDHGRRKKREG